MKSNTLLIIVCLAVALVPTIMAAADAVPIPANFTNHLPHNASTVRGLKTKYKKCEPPPNAVPGVWLYDMLNKDYLGCTSDHDSNKPWIMLNAYRGGGIKGQNWRSKGDEEWNDPMCLKDWTYYGKDGVWVVGKVEGEYTTRGESKPWCALPRYQKRGKQGFQRDYCTCEHA